MLLYLAALIGIAVGMGIAFQTGINAVLRKAVVSPLLSSFVSFFVGSVVLILLLILQGETLAITDDVVVKSPWWIWFGGLLVMFGLTVNILIFPRLGSVQTAIMPILGQVITGSLIDTFGWFSAPEYEVTPLRIVGLASVLVGIFVAIVLPSLKQQTQRREGSIFIWQLLGILGGVASGITPAVNATLRLTLNSTLQSVLVPFVIGTVLLAVVISFKEPIAWRNLAVTIKRPQPYWQWFGGILGAIYIGGIVIIVPEIGTEGAIVTSLLGLLIGSLLIDQFGLLGANKKTIGFWQILGLIILLAGIVMIQLSK
ncbi:orotate transporter [Rodentibacter genomosp. 2]|uniref:DMT family transporter n=1 Tax=Rodentibacter genomosp. 2 TaxID=1908266 RepID=UPI0009866AC9|nr:orotate transporter [Rodentibacter genomosp. 2]